MLTSWHGLKNDSTIVVMSNNEDRYLQLVTETRERWLARPKEWGRPRVVAPRRSTPLHIWQKERLPRWETLDTFNGALGYKLTVIIDHDDYGRTPVMPESSKITKEIFRQFNLSGMNQKKLCLASRINRSSIYSYAIGRSHPLPLTAIRIFDVLGCDLSYHFD